MTLQKIKVLNVTHFEHTIIAIGVQAATLLVACTLWGMSMAVVWLSALPGMFLFFGREQAQAESRLQDALHTKELPWSITLNACRFWDWDDDSQADFVCPVIGCMLFSVVLCFFV